MPRGFADLSRCRRRVSSLFFWGLLVVAAVGSSGCSVYNYLKPDGPPPDEQLYEIYSQTQLKVSTSVDVLGSMFLPEEELLSQSESVVATQGQKREGHKLWYNMVTFDQNKATATRKYIFIVDDRENLMEEARKQLSFDCAMVLEAEFLAGQYASENARRIAILERVRENAWADASRVGTDNNKLDVCAMMVNQALGAAVVSLGSSPAKASDLPKPEGMEFSHISYNTGRIRMLLSGDVVTVKLRLGRAAKKMADGVE